MMALSDDEKKFDDTDTCDVYSFRHKTSVDVHDWHINIVSHTTDVL